MKERRKRLNRGDFFLILLFLLSAAGILARTWHGERPIPTHTYAVEGEWRSVDARTAACLREGEPLYTESGELFGRVTELQVLWEPLSERCRVRLSVAVEGRFSDGILLRRGTAGICVGETYLLYSDAARVPLTVLFYAETPL